MADTGGLEPVTAGRPGAGRLLRGVLGGRGVGFAFAQTMLAQVLVLAVNIGTGVLTARLLGPEGRGAFGAITFWAPFLAGVALGGLPVAIVYHVRNAGPAEERDVLGAAMVLCLGLGGLSAIVALLIVPRALGTHYPPEILAMVPLVALVTLFCAVSAILKQGFTAIGLFGSFNTVSWMDPAIYAVLLGLAAVSTTLTAPVAALCLWTATVICLAFMVWRLWAARRPRFGALRRWLPALASYSWRAAGIGTLGSLVQYMDRVVLVAMIPAPEFGLYIVAYSLSRLLVVVQTTVAAVILPALTAQVGNAAGELHDRTFRLVFCAVGLGVLGGWLLSKPALTLLYGAEFADARLLFTILVIEAALACLSQVTSQLYLAQGRPGFTSIVQVVTLAGLGIGLVLLVPPLGAIGAALAVALAALLRLAILLGAMPGILGRRPPGLLPLVGEVRGYLGALRR